MGSTAIDKGVRGHKAVAKARGTRFAKAIMGRSIKGVMDKGFREVRSTSTANMYGRMRCRTCIGLVNRE